MGRSQHNPLRRAALALVACVVFGYAALVARSVVAEPTARPYVPVHAEPGCKCLVEMTRRIGYL
jgi:hypothetical protein